MACMVRGGRTWPGKRGEDMACMVRGGGGHGLVRGGRRTWPGKRGEDMACMVRGGGRTWPAW